MSMDSLKDLYIDELKDLYNAENQLVKALPKMAKAATDEASRLAARIGGAPERYGKVDGSGGSRRRGRRVALTEEREPEWSRRRNSVR